MARIFKMIIIVLAAAGDLLAQDFHFSQFYASPLTLNPALTGLMTGDYRVAANYRNQSNTLTPFTTYSSSFDTKILRKILSKDVFSIGVVVVRDELNNKSINNTVAMFSTAYHNRIGENDYLAAGLQGGLYQRFANMNVFKFPEQWDPTTGDATRPVTEQFQDMNVALFDLNMGLMWYHYIGKSSSVFLGGSVIHLTQPKAKYLNSAGIIPRRYVIHGGTRMSLENNFSLIPNFILMKQEKATEVVLGTTAEYRTDNGNAFKTGGWFRFKNTFILFLGMEFKGIEIGASYDFISSGRYLGQNKGGVEVSVIFTSLYKKTVTLNGNPGMRF